MVTHIHAKAFAGTRGGVGGGNVILKNVLDSYISLCKTDCSTQNFTPLKHLISKTDFTAIKYSSQGSFKVKKGTIVTENHRHLPIASVYDPLKRQISWQFKTANFHYMDAQY